MKKYIKYLLLCSLCMIIGEGVYLNVVSDSYQIEKVIMAYDLSFDNINQCFHEDDSPKTSNLKPVVAYKYKTTGEYVYYQNAAGERIVCDNPDVELVTLIPNCDFDGWYLDEALTQKVTGTKVGDVLKQKEVVYDENGCLIGINYMTNLYTACKEETVCTDNYEKSYKLNYYVDGKLNKTVKVNTSATADLSKLTKAGYTFDGWYLDAEYKTKVTTITPKELKDAKNCITGYEDVTIYGKFIKNNETEEVCTDNYEKSYKLNYYVDGKLDKTVKVNTNATADLSKLTKAGYTFDGWYLDAEYKTKVTTITPKELKDAKNCITGYEDITIYGKFIKNNEPEEVCTDKYEKSFNVNYYVDGNLEHTEKVDIDERVNLTKLEKEGYTFDGWYLDAKFETKADLITVIEVTDEKNCITGYEDVNLYAKFIKKTENPETSDNILIFIGLGFVLLLGSCVTIKKLTNK